jgi:hypothetical protein
VIKKVENGIVSEMTPEEEAQYWLSLPAPSDEAPPQPQLYAIAQLVISGNDIYAVDVSTKLSAVIRIDVGMYGVFFTEPMPDAGYLALAYNGGGYRCFVKSEDKFEDYLILYAVDLEGNPSDPAAISLEIKRVD